MLDNPKLSIIRTAKTTSFAYKPQQHSDVQLRRFMCKGEDSKVQSKSPFLESQPKYGHLRAKKKNRYSANYFEPF